jgi:hypothetical protein
MTIIKSILRSSGLISRGDASIREVEEELRFHVEMRAHDNIAAGMSAEDAVADAMRRFGDFDHIRTACEDISKERQESLMKLAKGLLWIMLGCGLTLKLATQSPQLRLVGHFLTMIAVLWRLLIFLREIRPDQQRIVTAGQPALSVIHTSGNFSAGDIAEARPRFVPPFDKDGRTPVERLISDESSGGITK